MTNTPHKKRMGFRTSVMHKKKEPHAFHYLSQRMSFWIAVVSVFAFVTGNMIGQHGVYAFLHSVMGGFDDSLIVYDGTVTPVERVPDFTRWSLYGGSAGAHTYRQVPSDLLVAMPTYAPADERSENDKLANNLYSVDNFGTYATGGGEGSHPGIDIRLPEGTPIRAIMNAHVVKVAEDGGGFGKYVLLRHPRVPDPRDPKRTTTLYTLYAHLSVQLVSEGDVVHRAQVIGASGMTGNASGPHLHFQMQREECEDDGTVIGASAFWPFTTKDMREAGLSFSQAIDQGLKREHGLQCTENPMLYIQANYTPLVKPLVASARDSSSSVAVRRAARMTREERIAARRARASERVAAVTIPAIPQAASTSASSVSFIASHEEDESPAVAPALVRTETIAYAEAAPAGTSIATVDIRLDRTFSGRQWSTMVVTLLDANGHTVKDAGALVSDLYLRTAFGSAEFKPSVLGPMDFKNGQAEVRILPHGQKTVVVAVQPLNVTSEPMRFVKE